MKKHNHLVGIIVLGSMILLVVIIKLLTSQTGKEIDQTEATIYSGTAELSEISSVLPGTGTLTDETAIDLELPAEVEITDWYVSNGDTVTTGDKLAQVDPVSVMSAIVSVQEKMALLDEDLEEHDSDEIADTIEATADGKVKVIYAKEDTGVVETMYEYGALMRISLDGLMAVSLETEAELSAGELVTVTLSDDTQLSGKVESMQDGAAVITVSDEDTEYEDSVTVTKEDGTVVGTGNLYIHSELKVTGFTGTISDVEVSVDEDVSSGETLLTLTDTDYTGEYEALLAKRSELEAYMQTLFQMYQDGYIFASCDGVISGLDTSTVSETAESNVEESAEMETDAAESSEEESAAAGSNAEESAEAGTNSSEVTEVSSSRRVAVIKTMSYSNTNSNGGMRTVTSAAPESDANTGNSGTASENSGIQETTPDMTPSEGGTTGSTPSEGGSTESTPDNGGDSGTPPGDGGDSGTTAGDGGDSGTTPGDGGNSGTTPGDGGATGTTPGDGDAAGTAPGTGGDNQASDNGSYKNYIGTVSVVSTDGSVVTIQLASTNGVGGTALSIPASSQVYAFMNGKYMVSRASDIQVGDMLMLVYESGNSESPIFCIRISGSTANESGMPNGSDMTQGSQGDITGQIPSGNTGSFDMDSSMYSDVMTTLEEEVENDYGVTTTTWLSVIPQEKMEITITVDEMDILSLEEGQEALVTVDAFPGQSFQGTVMGINLTGTNSGGSSKYEAVISIAREANMLSGMNASVQITLDTQENVLSIPVAALVEQDSGVYVYTSYDEKTETFGNLVEVTTGVSDGENVEILSGLTEGSEYWYSYLDVVNYSTAIFEGGGFSIGSMFGGRR